MHMCTHLQHPAASSVHCVQYETHPATSGVRNFHLISDTPLTSLHKKVFMCLLAISLMYFLIELVSQLLFFQSPHYFTGQRLLFRSLPCGSLFRAGHNMTACFIRISMIEEQERERICKQDRRAHLLLPNLECNTPSFLLLEANHLSVRQLTNQQQDLYLTCICLRVFKF